MKTTIAIPTPDGLITALGGPVAVARLLTNAGHPITPQAVSIWKTTGIPNERLLQIALAKGRVLRSTTDVGPANWSRLFPELKTHQAA